MGRDQDIYKQTVCESNVTDSVTGYFYFGYVNEYGGVSCGCTCISLQKLSEQNKSEFETLQITLGSSKAFCSASTV